VDEYGDTVDVMGATSGHFNAYQKERLGWLNAGVSPPITTVATTTPGTVTLSIAPMENARDGVPRALKIPRGTSCTATNEYLYIESRQAKGFDSFLSTNANVQTGVLVHRITNGAADSSYLLDMTPATTSWSDPALVAGLSFTDPASGITITPLAVGAAGAQVSVTVPGAACARANPVLTLAPSGTVWTTVGATTTYTATVTNKDGCGCTASTFDLSAAVPTGWASNTGRTASIAPGASGSTTLQVTSAAGASGFYTVPINAANTVAPASAASVASTVSVSSSLTVTTAANPSSYTLPTRGNSTTYATITTSVASGATAVSGAAVKVTITDPAGVASTLSATTSSAGTASVSYPMSNRNAKRGTYGVKTTGTMGSITSTATASFAVK
jgi:hypothetical protein